MLLINPLKHELLAQHARPDRLGSFVLLLERGDELRVLKQRRLEIEIVHEPVDPIGADRLAQFQIQVTHPATRARDSLQEQREKTHARLNSSSLLTSLH